MKSIAIAMIAHNEERNIARSLKSVSWADQIVVIDCESTDNTAEIARSFGALVYQKYNQANLNINKNFAIDFCNTDWILVLDADEIITDELAGEIRLVMNTGLADGYFFKRRNHMMGKWLKHGGQYPDLQLRLFRKGKGKFAARHVHERILIDGRVDELVYPFDHYPYQTLKDVMKKGFFYSEFEGDALIQKNTSVSDFRIYWNIIVIAPIRFLRRFIFKGGFLDGLPGLIAAFFDYFNNVVRWFRLWELQQTRRDNKITEGNG